MLLAYKQINLDWNWNFREVMLKIAYYSIRLSE